MTPRRLLTPDDVATRTGLTRVQVDRLIKRRQLRAIHYGARTPRVTLNALGEYVIAVIRKANEDDH
ncbi:hypothetical protein LCGC14_0391240 [marine sediment metagenome]|uniref:Helix-turn-helix domain-containing protein n=1 Tax=marine sediment metagenome TaxID=412755 RepID=A0A0F9W8F6_9ZZZZ